MRDHLESGVPSGAAAAIVDVGVVALGCGCISKMASISTATP